MPVSWYIMSQSFSWLQGSDVILMNSLVVVTVLGFLVVSSILIEYWLGLVWYVSVIVPVPCHLFG